MGQHGAAMSLSGYMAPGSVLLELQPVLNAIFPQIAAAAGLLYHTTPLIGRGSIYKEQSGHQHIELVPSAVVQLVQRLLVEAAL